MDTLEHMITTPIALRLGWSLAHFVWEGALLAAIIALLLWCLRGRSANARYLATAAGMLVMALAVPATFVAMPGPNTAWSVDTASSSSPRSTAVEVARTDGRVEPSRQDEGRSATSGESLALIRHDPAATASVPWHASALAAVDRLMPWAVAAWLAGVVALSLRLLAGWLIVQRLRRRLVEPVSDQLRRQVESLAQRLGIRRTVQTLLSQLTEVPSAVGWLKPAILLPVSTLTGLTPEQLEAVLAHELAHIRRYDYLVNLLQSAVETVLFYHPAVWWVSRRMRVEREHCCDDLAVAVCGNPVVYARALSSMESFRRTPQLLAAATGGSLLCRIRRVLGVAAPAGNQFSQYTAGLLVVATMLAFFAVVEVSTAGGQRDDLAKRSQSAANLKEIGNAAATYASRSDTPKRFNLVDLVNAGLLAADKLKSPLASDASAPSYVLVPPGHSKQADPADIIGYEDPAHYGNQGTNVLYPDAHTDYLVLAGFTRAISETYARRRLELPADIARLCRTDTRPATASGPAAEPADMRSQPHRWRHFERIVIGKDAITFEGLLTDWGHIGEQIENPYGLAYASGMGGGYGGPDPAEIRRSQLKQTVLEVAQATPGISEKAFQQALARAGQLAAKHGYEYVSDIGVHPLGSRGSRSQYLPPLTQRGRWRHYVRYIPGLVLRNLNGLSAGLKSPIESLASLPEPQWTMLELAVAPGTMTPEQYETVRQEARKLVEQNGLEGVVDLGIRPVDEQASPSIFVPDEKQPGEWTHDVLLVAGRGVVSFQGQPVTWEELPARLQAVPDRSHTVFCFAYNEVHSRGGNLDPTLRDRAFEIARGLGFKYLSNVGFAFLDAKGGPSVFAPAAPARRPASQPASTAEGLPMPEVLTPTGANSQTAETLYVRSQAEGVIQEILVKPGQKVRAGDVLIRLDDEEIKIELDDAKTRLDSSRRLAALSKSRYEQGLADELSYRQAEAAAQTAEIDVRRWTLKFERTQIKSPCDGRIVGSRDKPVPSTGELVHAGDVLLHVAQTATSPAGQVPGAAPPVR